MQALESLYLAGLELGNSLNDLQLPPSPHFRNIYLEDYETTDLDLAFLSPVANSIISLDFRSFYELTQLTNNNNVVLPHLLDFEVFLCLRGLV